MTPELANEYIKRRMKELGHGDRYHIRFRHFVLAPLEERKIETPLQLLILAAPKENIRIQSDMGIFDVAEFSTNELQYEHKGTVQLTNYSPIPQQVQMIQVIFKSK
jgi:hypothetical protein